MKLNKKYIYPKTIREAINGKRHYNINDGKYKLPSVTTILSATQDPEKTASLNAWRLKMGEDNAARIVEESAARGTAMHKILEKYILEEGYLDETVVGKQAHNMAIRVIEQGLSNISEYYGTECTLYYPGLYAGQTDLVALHKNELAIVDFKQTNKPKKREWIEDYCIQLAAYAMAHNYVYKTNIAKGVVMMCSKDNYYQEFVIEGKEFQKYMHKFLEKVDQYYKPNRTFKNRGEKWDYRVKITIRNDRLLKAIEKNKIHSVRKFCMLYDIDYGKTCHIISGKLKPLNKKGNPIAIVNKILDCLNISLEDAFTERQLKGFVKTNYQISMSEDNLKQLISPIKNQEHKFIEKDVKLKISEAFSRRLNPREEKILRLRYGFGDEKENSLSEIAKIFNVSKSRIGEIIKRAEIKLKHPSVSNNIINTGFAEIYTKVKLDNELIKNAQRGAKINGL
jgi:RNA polymerase sigma factor (sigma-70 family)